ALEITAAENSDSAELSHRPVPLYTLAGGIVHGPCRAVNGRLAAGGVTAPRPADSARMYRPAAVRAISSAGGSKGNATMSTLLRRSLGGLIVLWVLVAAPGSGGAAAPTDDGGLTAY